MLKTKSQLIFAATAAVMMAFQWKPPTPAYPPTSAGDNGAVSFLFTVGVLGGITAFIGGLSACNCFNRLAKKGPKRRFFRYISPCVDVIFLALAAGAIAVSTIYPLPRIFTPSFLYFDAEADRLGGPAREKRSGCRSHKLPGKFGHLPGLHNANGSYGNGWPRRSHGVHMLYLGNSSYKEKEVDFLQRVKVYAGRGQTGLGLGNTSAHGTAGSRCSPLSPSLSQGERRTRKGHMSMGMGCLGVGKQHNLFRGSQNLAEECNQVLRPLIAGINHEYLRFFDRLSE